MQSTPPDTGLSPNRDNLPPLLARLRDSSCDDIQLLLEEFFARCDDSLFDSAESAENNRDQNLYFEAMRELRMQKKDICYRYLQAYRNGFTQMNKKAERSKSATLSSMNLDLAEIQLVNNDELEESVAVKSIVGKARNLFAEQLVQLNARLGHVLGTQSLPDERSPLDPGRLVEYFVDSTRSLELDLRIRVFLYKRFDQAVVSRLASVYDSANELLIIGGVLPKLKLQIRNAANDAGSVSARKGRQADSRAPVDQPETNELAELQKLLSSVRTSLAQLPGMVDLQEFRQGPELSSQDLLEILSKPPPQAAAHSGEDLPQLIRQLLKHRQLSGNPTAIRSADEHTINLVSMFFDFILDDEALPLDMQALLLRLQIPVLKIALRDDYLFTTKDHPLRLLINELAHASYGRDSASNEHSDFYELASRVVHDLGENPEAQEEDFLELLLEIRDFLQDENEKSQAVEQRVSRSARNSALAKHAREKIDILLAEKFKGLEVPAVVRQFLQHDWQGLMLSTYLNHGEQSSEWLEADQLADDLLWTSQIHTDGKSLQRLQRLIPELQASMEEQMGLQFRNEQDWRPRFEEILRMHEYVLNKDVHSMKTYFAPANDADNCDTRADLGRDVSKHSDGPVTEFRYVRQIRNLKTGDWIRLQLPDSGGDKFCKIADYIDTEDSYLLVNRFGSRLAILSTALLAQNLQNGKLKIIENKPLFDQAIANISDKLRKLAHDD